MYGLDIETDTTVDGLDPRVSPVVAVALATVAATRVIVGDEASILRSLDAELGALPPGIVVTWNGSAFDLPFLHDRAAACGVPLGLSLHPDPAPHRSADALPGHECGYRARWWSHRHLDGYRVYRADVGASLGLSCGLKSMARLVGLRPVEVDRSRISELSAATLERYVASDAELARALVLRRWPGCAAAVDAVPEP